MTKSFIVTSEPIEDDVLIPLPDEFGVEVGDEIEAEQLPDGVIVLKVHKWKNAA